MAVILIGLIVAGLGLLAIWSFIEKQDLGARNNFYRLVFGAAGMPVGLYFVVAGLGAL